MALCCWGASCLCCVYCLMGSRLVYPHVELLRYYCRTTEYSCAVEQDPDPAEEKIKTGLLNVWAGVVSFTSSLSLSAVLCSLKSVLVVLFQAVADLGWSQPTLIQEKAVPLALEGKDLLARARTGSGKTAAYAIPVIQRVLASKQVRGKNRSDV